MIKHALLASSLAFLVNCGGGGGDSDSTEVVTSSTYTINSNNTNTVVSGGGPYDLTITGSNNTITINAEIEELTLNGSDNLLILVSPSDIDDCIVTGDNNAAETGTGSFADLNCDDFGSGNEGF